MTDLSTPGEIDGEIDNRSVSHAIQKGANLGWVVDGVDIADAYSAIDTTDVNAFSVVSTSGLDVTIDGGEAYCMGWLVRDRQTTITTPDEATTRLYVGYNPGVSLSGSAPADVDNVIIGPESDFGDDDPRIPLYTITTSGGTIDTIHDNRKTRPALERTDEGGTTADFLRLGFDRVKLPAVDGYRDGLLMGGADEDSVAYSALGDDAVIYAIDSAGAEIRFRNHLGPGDLLAVGNQSGNLWIRGNFDFGGQRFYYDRDQVGDKVHFQRANTAAETAITLYRGSPARVGISGQTEPVYPLDVSGTIHASGDIESDQLVESDEGLVPPDISGGSTPPGNVTGRIIYDSTREE